MNASTILTCVLLVVGAVAAQEPGVHAPSTTESPRPTQPNLVVVLADDLGFADTSDPRTTDGHPSTFFETPTLDRLAAEGTAFTNAYTNGPNCAPTRAALLTGQYAQRPTNNVFLVGDLNRGGKDTMLVGPDQGVELPGGGRTAQLPGAAVTIAETLRAAGYATAHLGKYHVGGGLDDNGPTQQGFDFDASRPSSGGPNSGYHATRDGDAWTFSCGTELDRYAAPYTQAYVDENIRPFSHDVDDDGLDALVGTPKHETDALADAAIDFIDAHPQRPLYVQFHQFAVHSPIGNPQARRDLLAKYRGRPGVDDDGDGPEVASYAALIEGLDQSLARLIAYLERTDDPRNPGHALAENTVVVFLSDNGGKQPQSNNGPLRGQKGELREGGIRVPMVAWSRSASLVRPGAIVRTPVSGIDLYPTFAGLAGADTSELTLDGESLAGLLDGSGSGLRRDALYWHLPGYLIGAGRDQRPESIVRAGKWKLVYGYETARYELYDLEADVGERTDLAATETEVRDRLAGTLRRWLVDTGAPMPTFRARTGYADGRTYDAGAAVPLPRVFGTDR